MKAKFVRRAGRMLMIEWIDVVEASYMTGRHKRAIYRWANDGLIDSKVVKTNPNQSRGKKMFRADQVMAMSDKLFIGYRSDLESKNGVVSRRRQPEFEEWQLEVARRVFGKC